MASPVSLSKSSGSNESSPSECTGDVMLSLTPDTVLGFGALELSISCCSRVTAPLGSMSRENASSRPAPPPGKVMVGLDDEGRL